MSGAGFASALVVGAGAGGFDLALGLGRAGLRVRLLEADQYTVARLTDLMGAVTDRVQVIADSPREAVDLMILAQSDGGVPDGLRAGLTLTCHGNPLPEGGIGFYPFTPLHLRPIVELTDPRAIPVARLLGLQTLLIAPQMPRPGQRIARRLEDAADGMLFHGAIPHELDEAMVAFGFDLGFYEAQDLIGLDVGFAARRLCPDRQFVPIADRMVHEGRLGKQAGVGWYRYPGGGGAVIDPLVEDLIREEAWFAKIPQRRFSVQEMQDAMVQALVQEGRALLEDGVLNDPAEYDRLACTGFGFPTALGGPLSWAATQKTG